MFKVFKVTIISVAILLLAGCSWLRQSNPAGIIDANNLQGTAAQIQAKGLGSVDDLSALKGLQKDVGPHNGAFVNRSFYFAFNSNVVNSKDYAIIKAHARYLLQHPQARVLLAGNTDIRGSREYNVALGQRRANAVKAILRMRGVPNKQIRTISYGAEKPIAFGHTDAAYKWNRRVDLRYEAN